MPPNCHNERAPGVSEDRPFHRTPSPQTASWFLDLNSAKQLDMDPPYQRRSVWNLEYRQFFIDSVIRNYPTQSIFLDVVIDPDSRTQYRVLDGKQRLSSLIGFTKNEFTTPDSLQDIGYDDTYYSDLPRDIKGRVLSYLFTVESVSEVTAAELNQAFDRLNRNVARLNKQELRHAQYGGGTFVNKMEKFAEEPIWEDIGLVTPARRRRMLDVEYVSEFYVIAALGIQDGKDYLDAIYAQFDEEIAGERRVDYRFRTTRNYVISLHQLLGLNATRYGNVADFYSLWAAIVAMNQQKILPSAGLAAESLRKFLIELDDQKTERAAAYLLAARQGSNKASNRELRTEILTAVLSGN